MSKLYDWLLKLGTKELSREQSIKNTEDIASNLSTYTASDCREDLLKLSIYKLEDALLEILEGGISRVSKDSDEIFFCNSNKKLYISITGYFRTSCIQFYYVHSPKRRVSAVKMPRVTDKMAQLIKKDDKAFRDKAIREEIATNESFLKLIKQHQTKR